MSTLTLLDVGFDFDGVFSDCGELKSRFIKQLYKVDAPPERCKKEILVGGGILTTEQYSGMQRLVYGTREIALSMKPVPGFLKYLPLLQKQGHRTRVVTSRDGQSVENAIEWTSLQGIQIDFTGVGNGKSKAEAAAGLDFYTDDDFDKLEDLTGIVPNIYIFSQGYNLDVEIGKTIGRLASWEALYEEIQMLSAR